MTSTLPAWLVAAHDRQPARPHGSLDLIDAAAVRRGLAAVTDGTVIPLGRPLVPGSAGGSELQLEVWSHDAGPVTSAYDRVGLVCHGTGITHMDALNHFALGDVFYGATTADPAAGIDIATLAAQPVVTRAIVLDLTEQLDGEHATSGEPVGADHLERALRRAGTDILPGDALLLYMGRDRFEAAGGAVAPIADSPNGRPGVGVDGARWIADKPIGTLGWDFLDAHPQPELGLPVHAVSWAVGLILMDSCVLGPLAAALAGRQVRTGLLMASPLPIVGGTGSAVNPVVVV